MYLIYKDKVPVKGAYETTAFMLYGSAARAGIKESKAEILTMFKKEADLYPAYKYPYRYYEVLWYPATPEIKVVINKKIASLLKSNDEDDLILASTLIGQPKQKAQLDSLNTAILKRFPKGTLANDKLKHRMLSDVWNEKNIDKKDSLFMLFMKRFPDTKEWDFYDGDFNHAKIDIATGLISAGNKRRFSEYVSHITGKIYLASELNRIAYEFAESGKNLKNAEYMSRQSLKILEENLKHPYVYDYFFTLKDAANEAAEGYKQYYWECLDTYAFVLYKNGKFKKAYKYEQEVYLKHIDNYVVKEHYVQILNAVGKYKEAQKIIETVIKDNKSNNTFEVELKKAYTCLNGNANGYGSYLKSLKSK